MNQQLRRATNAEIALAIERGARWLQRHRWLQCKSMDAMPPHTEAACVMGAMRAANWKRLGYDPVHVEAEFALGRSVDDGIRSWNDRRGRKKSEVVAAMRRCARLLRSGVEQ